MSKWGIFFNKWLMEIIFFSYLLIGLNTFGYTYHRWDDSRQLEVSGITYTIKTTPFERVIQSIGTSAVWPLYWIVRAYEP